MTHANSQDSGSHKWHELLYALLHQAGREDEFPERFREVNDEAARALAKELKRRGPRMLRQRRKIRRRFERGLFRRWRKALRLYEIVMVAALEAGADFNEKHRPAAIEENDLVFEALVSLHARASRIASETYALLRTGHSDGAQARWRTLHELAVVGSVIATGGQDLAERYLLHHYVQNARDARAYQDNCAALGYDPFTTEELDEITGAERKAVARFGPEFKKDYGWAATLTASGRAPSFRTLEKLSKLDHLRPFYGWASHQIHADAKGGYLNFATRGPQRMVIAGPTNAGLGDPGHGALISFAQLTTSLLLFGRGGEPQDTMDLVVASTLLLLCDDAGAVFLEAHERLEAEEEALWKETNGP
jgi:Family of unknown function (DUF5677)